VQFPIYLSLGAWSLHPHLVLETLAYVVGFRAYLARRRRQGDHLADGPRWSIVTAAAVGAVVGSRVLFWLEDPAATVAALHNLRALAAGKTLVGGLIGGWIAVEIAKRWAGISSRTGDLFAVPLAVAIAIGRIGCHLAGLADQTYGTPTSMPWGVDLGDGVSRHPAVLYESAALCALAFVLARAQRRPHAAGDLFKGFMVGYMLIRLVVDAFKAGHPLVLGLTTIQIAALAVIAYYAHDVARWNRSLLLPHSSPPRP